MLHRKNDGHEVPYCTDLGQWRFLHINRVFGFVRFVFAQDFDQGFAASVQMPPALFALTVIFTAVGTSGEDHAWLLFRTYPFASLTAFATTVPCVCAS